MRRSAIASITAVFLYSLLAALLPAAAASGVPAAPWPMAGHDAAHTGRTTYLGPSAPILKRGFESSMTSVFTGPSIDSSGTIYVGGPNGLYALDPDGSQKWRFDMPSHADGVPAIDASGTVYVGARVPLGPGERDTPDHALFYAVNPDGTQKWMVTGIEGSAAVDTSGTIYVWGHALGQDGTTKSTMAGEIADSTGVTYKSGGNVFWAYNPDGTVRWSWWNGTHDIYMCPPVLDDRLKTSYVAQHDGKLFSFTSTASSRKLPKWVFASGTQFYTAPCIGPDGTLYIGGSNGRLYAVSANGSLRRSSPVGFDRYAESPPIVDASGTVYFSSAGSVLGSEYRDVVAVNPDGTVKWRFAIPERGLRAPVIGFDHTLYVDGVDGFYAIGQAIGGISIKTDRTSVASGRQAVLTGSLTDTDTIGQVMDVQVKKPGKTYWSYSSNRRIYSSGGQAVWQYKYTFVWGMTKGTYRFMARYGGMSSGSVGVTLR